MDSKAQIMKQVGGLRYPFSKKGVGNIKRFFSGIARIQEMKNSFVSCPAGGPHDHIIGRTKPFKTMVQSDFLQSLSILCGLDFDIILLEKFTFYSK